MRSAFALHGLLPLPAPRFTASKTGGMAAVLVWPVDVPLATHATSASVPIPHVLPSLNRLTMPPAQVLPSPIS
jgi:hypothetical protein